MSAPVCPDCQGTGWRIVERGGLTGAERCGCVAAAQLAILEEAANIPPLYRQASFENFRLPQQQDNPAAHLALSNLLIQARSYAREFPLADRPGLLFIGDPGTGKTHLAVAVLRILISRGFECLFYDYKNLLDRIRAGWDDASGASDREAYQAALEAPVLLLDDLGAHRITGWVEDTVTSIITYRCNHQKPLLATTNLADPDAGDALVKRPAVPAGPATYRTSLAESIGVRARSRLFEMCRILKMPPVGDMRIERSRL